MRTITILAISALLASAPAALAAGWNAKGMHEPDTLRDVNDGWMRLSTPTGSGQVYFSGFTTHSAGYAAEVGTSLNPNVATLATGYSTFSGRAYAMIGVWKDCNNDGFVGLGDQGLFEYRAELLRDPATLADPGICTAQSTPDPIPRDWIPSHNDGTWVREWIPIGPDAQALTFTNGNPRADNNPFNLNDFDARAWMDWNLPESDVVTRCYGFPPMGTFQTTGGMIEYSDCFTGFTATSTWNAAVASTVGDGTVLGQLSFSDAPRDQGSSDSLLNQQNPWGPRGGDAHADALDCSDPLVAETPIPNTQYVARVPRPQAPGQPNTGGSIGGTVNETESDFEDCDREDGTQLNADNLAYAGERPIFNTVGGKKNTDFTLTFNEGFRNSGTTNPQSLGRAAPRDAGTRHTETEGFWSSTTRIGEDRNPWVDREALSVRAITHATFYGFVSPSAVARYGLDVLGPSSPYGAYHCGAEPTGEWDCDPATWWLNEDGSQQRQTTLATINSKTLFVAASVGDPFNLRDIDCYDYSAAGLRDSDVHWGALTGTECV